MDEENNNQQEQTDIENNPVSQMERKIADKTVEQVQDIANNLMSKAKKMAIEALKKLAKLIAKAAMNLLKLLIKIIIATAPVSFIVIGVIIITIILVAYYLALYGGLSNVFKNDVKSGDVSTSEIGSIYEESYIIHSDNNFTITATEDVVEISEQIHDFIAKEEYSYHQGNIMNYPNKAQGIDCSAFITWVLIQYGYTEFEGQYQLTTNDFICWILGSPGANYDLSHYGWEWATTEAETPQPGDFLLKVSESPHIEVFAGDGVGTYGAGTLDQIRKEISYNNCSTSRIINSGDFKYIIRVTKK